MADCSCSPTDPSVLRLEDYNAWMYGNHPKRHGSPRLYPTSMTPGEAAEQNMGKPSLSTTFSFTSFRSPRNKWTFEEQATTVSEEGKTEEYRDSKTRRKAKSAWKRLKKTACSSKNRIQKQLKRVTKKSFETDDFQERMEQRIRQRMEKEMLLPLHESDTHCLLATEIPPISTPATAPASVEKSELKTKEKLRWKKLRPSGSPSTTPSPLQAKGGKQKSKRDATNSNIRASPQTPLRDCAMTEASTDIGSPPSSTRLSFSPSSSWSEKPPSILSMKEPVNYPTPYPYEDDKIHPSPPPAPIRSFSYDVKDQKEKVERPKMPKIKKKTFDYRRFAPNQSKSTEEEEPSKNSVAAILSSFERFAKSRQPNKNRVKRVLKKIKKKRFPMMVLLGWALFQSVLAKRNSLSLLGGMTPGFISNPPSIGCVLKGLTTTMIGGLSVGSTAAPQLLSNTN
eukprot:scaffold3955_cov160-Cylindrotheca_fusiformis.AAC.21